ncbi:MAG: RICIN domain-containing protein [Alistipes sp.]|nr:RICIN domain-containing protein [Alistipes sp.]
MRNLLRYIVVCLTLVLAACQDSGSERSEAVSLTFRLSTAELTRGAVTDSPSNTDSWSQAEKAVDGRYLYTVSVYLVNEQKQIVARRENIAVENQANEVVVTFDENDDLKRGIYTLMAVANNADTTISGTTYDSGLLGTWASTTYDELMSNKIDAGGDNISPKDVVQPLSLMKEIELHAGSNMVEGELVRTFARIRIEVNNNSGTFPLKINNLTFSNNFAQKRAYVFDDGTTRKYFDQTAAPVATSDDALQPFVKDSGEDYKTVDAQTSAVVFDGYLLESKADAGEEYTYTLDLTYDGVVTTSSSFYRESNTAIYRTSSLTIDNESYFLIYNQNRGRYLSADENNRVISVTLSEFSNLSATNVWQLIKNGNNYYIKNVNSGMYMQAPTSSNVTMGNSPIAYSINNNNSNNYLALQSGNYIEVRDRVNGYLVRGNSKYGNSNRFYLYKVKKTTTQSAPQSITYKTPITLTSIDPVSQQSSNVTAIKRNDFINILVTVSYNPESGEFEFYVKDWESGGGNVEFN